MATLEQLSTALRNAHNAGDVESARRIAAEIEALSPPFSGGILPISRKEPGGPVSFDSDAGILGSAKRAVMATGEVMSGELDPNSPEGIARAMEMASWITPMNPAVRAGDKAIPGISRMPTKRLPPIPTADDLTRVGGKQIDKATKMGVDFDADAVANWARNTRAELERDIHPSRAPGSYELLHSLETAPPGSVMEFRGLVAARENFRDIAQSAASSPRDKLAATRIIQRIDGFLGGPPPESVLAGPSATAAHRYEVGRANYAAGKRSAGINAREDNAELQAVIANSGKNSGNRIRAAAGWYLDKNHPERLAGFTPGEIKLIEAVAYGNKGRNTLRYVGNLLGGGGGLGGLAAGAVTGGGAGAFAGRPGTGIVAGVAGPLVGMTARSADNRLTSNAMRRADEAIRMRSPLYDQAMKNAPLRRLQPPVRGAIKGAGIKTTLPTTRPWTEEEYQAYLAAGGA
jgi:hypothetical protein